MADQNDFWPFQVQWGSTVSETIEFNTTIFMSANKSQTRSSRRADPWKYLEFETVLAEAKLQRAMQLLSEAKARSLYFPHPRESLTLASPVLAGGSVLSFNEPLPYWVVAGEALVLDTGLKSPGEGAFVDVVGGTVTLQDPLQNGFPAGTRVRHGVSSWIRDNALSRASTQGLLLAQLAVDLDPKKTMHKDYSALPGLTLFGREVFTKKPNWASAVQVSFLQDFYDLNTGRGARNRRIPQDITARTTQATWAVRGALEEDEIVGLWYRVFGRRRSFFMSSRLSEIQFAADINSGDTSAVIQGREFFDSFQNSRTYGFLEVSTTIGVQYLEILSVALNGSFDTVVSFSSPVVPGVSTQDTTRVSWLLKSRFASDALTIEWETTTHGAVDMAFTTVEKDE